MCRARSCILVFTFTILPSLGPSLFCLFANSLLFRFLLFFLIIVFSLLLWTIPSSLSNNLDESKTIFVLKRKNFDFTRNISQTYCWKLQFEQNHMHRQWAWNRTCAQYYSSRINSFDVKIYRFCAELLVFERNSLCWTNFLFVCCGLVRKLPVDQQFVIFVVFACVENAICQSWVKYSAVWNSQMLKWAFYLVQRTKTVHSV